MRDTGLVRTFGLKNYGLILDLRSTSARGLLPHAKVLMPRCNHADFIDPCSGLPMLTLNCNKVRLPMCLYCVARKRMCIRLTLLVAQCYSEVDGMECCLGYKAYNAGFCKVLTHPSWGSAVYPATIFAHAPRGLILRLVDGYPKLEEAMCR